MMLKKVFDMDNPIMQGLSAAFDLMLLNILALIAALPVITAGASLVALFDVAGRLARNEDIYIARQFFGSFRQNIKKGIVLGLIFILAAAIIVVNYMTAVRVIPNFRYVSLAVALIVLSVGIYSFGLMARFENSLINTLKNALMLTIGFFPRTLIMVVITLAYYLLSMRFHQIGMPLMMLFGISFPAYVYAVISEPIFDKINKTEEKTFK